MLGRGHISKIAQNALFLYKIIFSSSQAQIRQTKYVVMMTKEGSPNFVNFMTPGAGVLVLGRGHMSHIGKMHYLNLFL